MRKLYVVVFTIVLLVISFFVGQYIYKISRLDESLMKVKAEFAKLELQNQSELRMTTASSNIKISPNAILIFKTTYNECGHTLNEYKNVEENEVNLNKQELEKLYEEWEIEEFSEKEIVLLKAIEENCNQHFVIREKDGNLAVYIIDEENKEKLKEITNISTEYLTELDLLKLEDGIKVNGLEELNAKLEDFE